MKPYTCKNCGKQYAVPPKHCQCTPYDPSGLQEMYILIETKDDINHETYVSKILYDDFVHTLEKQKKIRDAKRLDKLSSSPYQLVHRQAMPGVEVLWHDVIDETIPLTKSEYESFLKTAKVVSSQEQVAKFISWSKRKIHNEFAKLSKDLPPLKDFKYATSTEFSLTYQGKKCQIILEFAYPATEQTDIMIHLKDGTSVGIVAEANCDAKGVEQKLKQIMQHEIAQLRKVLAELEEKD